MNVLFENVTLAFTNCMTHESDFGGYSYSFVIDKDKFCETVRDTLALQKKPVWDAKKNTDEFILEKCNAKVSLTVSQNLSLSITNEYEYPPKSLSRVMQLVKPSFTFSNNTFMFFLRNV